MIKHPDFPQWLETRTGRVCNDINNLSEQRFLTNRLSWAFDAGRNCVWDQFIEMKAERNALQDENKRLTNDLKDALGIKAGEGPTALSMVVDENKQLRDLLRKGLHAVKPEEIQEFWTRARKLLNL